MTILQIAAILLVLAAGFGAVNYLFLRLPSTIFLDVARAEWGFALALMRDLVAHNCKRKIKFSWIGLR